MALEGARIERTAAHARASLADPRARSSLRAWGPMTRSSPPTSGRCRSATTSPRTSATSIRATSSRWCGSATTARSARSRSASCRTSPTRPRTCCASTASSAATASRSCCRRRPRPRRSSSAPGSSARSCSRCRSSTATTASATASTTPSRRVLVTDRPTRRASTAWGGTVLTIDGPARRRARPTTIATDTAADDPAQLYYTSGTTGLAKGIVHAHRYLLAHEEFIYCHEVQDGERFHGMGEWAWAAGHRAAARAVAARRGAVRLPARGRLRPAQAARLPQPPRGHERLHDADRDAGDDGASSDAGTRYPQQFRRVCSAGEPLNPEAITWFRDQYGLTVLDYYGLTESYPLCANFPWMDVREGSMGRPMPGWDVQILDEDEQPVAAGRARRDLPARAVEPALAARLLAQRRRRREETFGGEWFHTKDAAVQDEDGYVWYAGRADDVIIAAGYRIGPFEVESACLEHPAVREAAAVASPGRAQGPRGQGVHLRRRGPRAVRRARRRDQARSSASG